MRGRRAQPEVFLVASLLLRYPTATLLDAAQELEDVIRGLRDRASREPLSRLLAHCCETPLLDLERSYVETFDLLRRRTLNVSYYLYGDTRRRGIALLRLKRLYAAAGLILESDELPDHLPVMLEFAGHAPDGYGEQVLQEYRVGLELLRIALREPYRPHLDAVDAVCAALPALGIREASAVRRLAAEGPPDEQVGLQPFAPPEVMPTGGRV